MITVFLGSTLVLIYMINYSSYDIVRFSSVGGNFLRNGEWWRLFTAPYVHLNIEHIVGNIIALLLVGRRLEPLIGSGNFVLIFVIGAFVSAMGSAALNPPNVSSVGASGAIQGLFFALFVVGLVRGRRTVEGQRICRDALGLGVLGMAYSSISDFMGRALSVDLMAHICGGLAGAFAGLILLVPSNAPVAEESNGLRPIWKMRAAVALVMMTLSLGIIIIARPVLPYLQMRLWGIAAVLLTAAIVAFYDSLSAASPAAYGAPFSLRRAVYTQRKAAIFILFFIFVWGMCMYFR